MQDEGTRIRWLEWGDEAFKRAREENKPILLDISASWCHWCHRLDKDTFAVPEIAEYIQTNFIPIRVDTDQRPDINRRYNMGGWPTTAFLTPDGHLLAGGTYLPPDQMRKVLQDVTSNWRSRRGEIPKLSEPSQREKPSTSILSTQIVEEILGETANNFDSIYGGFGSQPKFPNIEALELALSKFHYSKNREFLRMVTVTLQNAGKGGVYDKEMGGFFRYATQRDWSIPHYEKMCEDNAKWLRLYMHAYQATGEAFYLEIAKGIVNYVTEWLSDQNGCGFYGSQDADEEYYSLSKDERSSRTPPSIDKTIYSNWNAMMISSYLEASFTMNNLSMREFAIKSIDRLLELNYRAGLGMYHFYNGASQQPNLLSDHAWTARMLCTAYQATGRRRYLKSAEELMELAISNLYDSKQGAFFDTAVNTEAEGYLRHPLKPLDDNSIAAQALITLHHLTGKEDYRAKADETLKWFTETYPEFGFMAADYGSAVDLILHEPTTIRIVGSLTNTNTQNLLQEANRIYDPRKVIQILDPEEDSSAIKELGYEPSTIPKVYLCVGKVCAAPVSSPSDLLGEMQRLSIAEIKK